jgi:thiamine monophosphate kinase
VDTPLWDQLGRDFEQVFSIKENAKAYFEAIGKMAKVEDITGITDDNGPKHQHRHGKEVERASGAGR